MSEACEVWLVWGCSGSYDDYREWVVKAFVDEHKAAAFARELQEWHNAHKRDDDAKNPLDERYDNVDGVEYGHYSVPLVA